MGSLILTLLVVGVTLTVLLWGGTVFLQSYWYTEASTAVFWQAPVAGLTITLFYLVWCLLNANAAGATSTKIPYNTLFAFSIEVEKYPNARGVEHLWTLKKTGESTKHKRQRAAQDQDKYQVQYKDGSLGPDYRPSGIVAVELDENGQKVRYNLVEDESGRRFVSEDGWVIQEGKYGIEGNPTSSSTGLLLGNLLLNLLHLTIWFGCLWLLLRFQWSHALLLALALWVIMTIFVLPLLLGQAGAVAQASPRSAGQTQNPRVATHGRQHVTNDVGSSSLT